MDRPSRHPPTTQKTGTERDVRQRTGGFGDSKPSEIAALEAATFLCPRRSMRDTGRTTIHFERIKNLTGERLGGGVCKALVHKTNHRIRSQIFPRNKGEGIICGGGNPDTLDITET